MTCLFWIRSTWKKRRLIKLSSLVLGLFISISCFYLLAEETRMLDRNDSIRMVIQDLIHDIQQVSFPEEKPIFQQHDRYKALIGLIENVTQEITLLRNNMIQQIGNMNNIELSGRAGGKKITIDMYKKQQDWQKVSKIKRVKTVDYKCTIDNDKVTKNTLYCGLYPALQYYTPVVSKCNTSECSRSLPDQQLKPPKVQLHRFGIVNVFLHIFPTSDVNPVGKVTFGDYDIIPNSCLTKAIDNYKRTPTQYTKEIFVIAQMWGNAYYHTFVENIPRIAPYIEFLKLNPDIKIHVAQVNQVVTDYLGVLGFEKDRLVTGFWFAAIVYMPKGSGCGKLLQSHGQIITAYYHEYIRQNIAAQIDNNNQHNFESDSSNRSDDNRINLDSSNRNDDNRINLDSINRNDDNRINFHNDSSNRSNNTRIHFKSGFTNRNDDTRINFHNNSFNSINNHRLYNVSDSKLDTKVMDNQNHTNKPPSVQADRQYLAHPTEQGMPVTVSRLNGIETPERLISKDYVKNNLNFKSDSSNRNDDNKINFHNDSSNRKDDNRIDNDKNKTSDIHIPTSEGYVKNNLNFKSDSSNRNDDNIISIISSNRNDDNRIDIPQVNNIINNTNTKNQSLYLNRSERKQSTQITNERKSILLIKRAKSRTLVQNDKIAQYLNTKSVEFDLDFVVFDDSNLPGREETMFMFYSATLIVAPHGAGLSNVLFSQAGSVVIEIMCAHKKNACFKTIVEQQGMVYHGIMADKNETTPPCATLSTDTELLFETIDFYLGYIIKRSIKNN